jgi:tetratricopeptide (TPR) repeat protein
MHVYEPYLRKIIPWGLFFFAVFFYTDSLCPTISWRDSPEFVTVSQNLDISHPAGSPTYSLSSKLLTLVPIGNIALRVNLFSSISSSLCISLIFILLYQILDCEFPVARIIASAGGSLSLTGCQSFWTFSSITEVYAFQNFFLILLLILLIKSHSLISSSNLRLKYSFTFLYGLSLGVHASMAIFIPAFLIYALISDKSTLQTKKFAFILFFSILGFLTYILLPFRSVSPIVFDWGNPETFYRFLGQIFDRKDSDKGIYYLTHISLFEFKRYIGHLINEFSIILCLMGIIGFFRLLILRFQIAILLFFIFISNIAFFMNAGWTVSWGYIPSFVIFSIFIGNGICFLDTMKTISFGRNSNYNIPKILKYINYTIITIIIFFLIKRNMSLELNIDYSTKLVGKKILSELPSDSILFSEYMWFPLLYLQQIEHRRPDLTFILQAEIFLPEYFETISKKRFPNIKQIDMSNNNDIMSYEYFWELAKANTDDHPLFWEPDSHTQELITEYITPRGMLFSFNPYKKREITRIEIEQMNTYLHKLLKYEMKLIENMEGRRYIANKINYIANFWSKLQNEDQVLKTYDTAIKVWPQGETINNNYGAYLMSKGYMSKAAKYLKNSYDISSRNLIAYKNLANLMFKIKNYRASLYFLKNFTNLSRKTDADIESLFGAVYYELGKYSDAKESLEGALDILKNKSSSKTSEIKYKNKFKWIKLYREFCFEKMMENDSTGSKTAP